MRKTVTNHSSEKKNGPEILLARFGGGGIIANTRLFHTKGCSNRSRAGVDSALRSNLQKPTPTTQAAAVARMTPQITEIADIAGGGDLVGLLGPHALVTLLTSLVKARRCCALLTRALARVRRGRQAPQGKRAGPAR